MSRLRNRSHRTRVRSLAVTGVLMTLAAPGAAHALSRTAPGHVVPTFTFPVPASARVQPGTGGTGSAPTGKTGAPTATATSPRTLAAPTRVTPVITAATRPPTIASKSAAGAHPVAGARSAGSSSRLSTPAIVAAVIAALLALGCAVWVVARSQAFEPHWTLSLRHTLAEAGFRASATWAELSDWARLGR
jgi:hypothetical protein